MLAREPETYTVGTILRLTEGSMKPVACLEDEPNQCSRSRGMRHTPSLEDA